MQSLIEKFMWMW